MAIIDTIQGWLVQEGDFIIVPLEDERHEVEVLRVGDAVIDFYSYSTGDRHSNYTIDLFGDYEVWGE